MDHLTCDLCGSALLLDSDVRYEVKAAYDPMELTDEDLAKDHEAQMRRALEKLKGMTEQEAQDEVYRLFTFDLCLSCQKRFLKNPLAKAYRA